MNKRVKINQKHKLNTMKRVIIIGVLLVSYFQIQAQKIGVVAGVNFNKPIEGQDGKYVAYQYGLGYQIGLKTVFSISDKIELAPQLLFINTHTAIKGLKLVNPNSQSLGLPILVHYKINPKITIQAGPSIDYRIKKEPITLQRMVVRGTLGLGYHFTDNLELNLQYTYSLYNEVSNDKGLALLGTVKNSTLMFSMAYYFKK